MSRNLKSIVVVCSLALAAISSPVQARILTLTTTGTISGQDFMDAFSSSGFVDNEQFTETVSIDMAGLKSTTHTSVENIMSTSPGAPTMVTGSMTISGRTYAWKSGWADASAKLGRYVSAGQSGSGSDYVGMEFYAGNWFDPNYVTSRVSLWSNSTAFVNSVDFDQNTSFNTSAAGVSSFLEFHIVRWEDDPAVQLNSWNSITTAVWTISAVPEPGTAGMLMVGLGVMAAIRRRKGRA